MTNCHQSSVELRYLFSIYILLLLLLFLLYVTVYSYINRLYHFYTILIDLDGFLQWHGQENFTTPRAVVALRFFNCFRLLLEKADDAGELKIYVETLAFKPRGGLLRARKGL